jgi:hypothetical protein
MKTLILTTTALMMFGAALAAAEPGPLALNFHLALPPQHVTDCLGEATGTGGIGVSAGVSQLWR